MVQVFRKTLTTLLLLIQLVLTALAMPVNTTEGDAWSGCLWSFSPIVSLTIYHSTRGRLQACALVGLGGH
jgi:hypothetical protein